MVEVAPNDAYFLNEELLEQSKPTVPVQGRLRTCSNFWENTLKPSSFMQGIVDSGYRLPFLSYPAPVFMRNHSSAFENKDFVGKAIKELLAANCVVECRECPTVCSPLMVVKNAKGKADW